MSTDRAFALALGQSRYNGAPCPRGHGTLRSTRNCVCVQCERDSSREAMRAKRKADPRGVRRAQVAARLQKTYGITEEQYAAMFAAQNGYCKICPEKLTSRLDDSRPLDKGTGRVPNAVGRVDHDHATGKIRGLLCSNCNQGLGKFQDDEKILLNAVGYLRASATQQARPVAERESASSVEPAMGPQAEQYRGSRRDELHLFI